jgi:hypothetical protein
LGLHPIHVFHGGEPFSWLDRLIDNYEYIGIAASRFEIGVGPRYSFLDACWKKILDHKGNPIRKVHGFALTSPEVMIRYPWHSLDSSSWSQFGVYGNILVPAFDRPKLTYSNIAVSPHSPAQRKKRHYYNLSKEERRKVDDFIIQCGLTPKDILEEGVGSLKKDIVNIKYLLLLQEEVERRRGSISSQPGFFE